MERLAQAKPRLRQKVAPGQIGGVGLAEALLPLCVLSGAGAQLQAQRRIPDRPGHIK